MAELLRPDWPAPVTVCAASTTRIGGISRGVYAQLNLGGHVGDDPASVRQNRARLSQWLALPAEPLWLDQVHGDMVVTHSGETPPRPPRADALFSNRPGEVCVVLTADCLPLLLCNRAGTQVAAVHAGWRGLAAGVIESALARFDVSPAQLLAWLGPAIGPGRFEVGDEVRERFLAQAAEDAAAFVANRPGHWLADLYRLAGQRLRRAGVGWIGGGDRCTYSEPEHFFSYRRDGVTGRMATLVWLRPDG